jgi:hypothetical protein
MPEWGPLLPPGPLRDFKKPPAFKIPGLKPKGLRPATQGGVLRAKTLRPLHAVDASCSYQAQSALGPFQAPLATRADTAAMPSIAIAQARLTVRLPEAGQQLMHVPIISIRSNRLYAVTVATSIGHALAMISGAYFQIWAMAGQF